MTPLLLAVMTNKKKAARLLLTWGAKSVSSPPSSISFGESELLTLMNTALGGRRCEFVGLKGRKDLNGETGVANEYVAAEERYIVEIEWTKEKVKVRPANLKRRDRTPTDCVLDPSSVVKKNKKNTNGTERNWGSTEDWTA